MESKWILDVVLMLDDFGCQPWIQQRLNLTFGRMPEWLQTALLDWIDKHDMNTPTAWKLNATGTDWRRR